MASCPECDSEIEVDELDEFDVDLGDRLNCTACGAVLEVVNIAPIEVAAESADSAEEEGDVDSPGESSSNWDQEDDWDE